MNISTVLFVAINRKIHSKVSEENNHTQLEKNILNKRTEALTSLLVVFFQLSVKGFVDY